MKLELIATSTFGLEAVVKREIQNLGFEIIKSEDGKITFTSDERGLIKANLWLRTADRILLKLAEFEAFEFEDLFQGVKSIDWEKWIPVDGNFKVDCSSVKSQLGSLRACQSVSEKAMIEKLKQTYKIDRFSKSGNPYTVKVTLLKDRATITLDSSGEALHKRGYRKKAVAAPIKETLAAGMLQLSFWHKDRILVDPCCGSGTIPIEAALIARNIAPGLNRKFASENWSAIPSKLWKQERAEAFKLINMDVEPKIIGRDISREAIDAAIENSEEAGVEDCIQWEVGSVKDFKAVGEGGIIVTNPPYGERIGEDKSIQRLFRDLKEIYNHNKTWSYFVITPEKKIEKSIMKQEANRRRKFYNGNLEVCYYQYHGEKPN